MACQAEQLAVALAVNFTNVRYNLEKRSGSATIPNVGTIEFRESGNDPAVIVNLMLPKWFKGSADTTMAFLETLMEAWRNSD
jgi:hypothetical protein